MKRPKDEYLVIGCVEYLGEVDIAKFGYVADYSGFPVLVYSRNTKETKDMTIENRLKGELFKTDNGFSMEQNYYIVPDHLISTRYSIEEAQAKFPEIFL